MGRNYSEQGAGRKEQAAKGRGLWPLYRAF